MITKGIGNVSLSRLLDYLKNSDDTIENLCEDKFQLLKILKCKDSVIADFENNEDNAKELLKKLHNNKVRILIKGQPDFPKRIESVLGKDCPVILFAKGNISLLNSNSIGFCGSRNASDKGLSITEQCAKQLVEQSLTVVSGYAKGTDIAAHSSAMKNNGNTVFILAEGILKFSIKPSVKDLINETNHVFVSQFSPHSSWSPSNAMKRNSLIIGLSSAMVLIESRNSGGTYAAGVETLKRKLPLFVVDYYSPEESAEANQFFIKNGGKPIRGKNNIPNIENIVLVSKQQSLANSLETSAQITWDAIVASS